LIQQGISIVETLEERSSHQEEEVRARLEEVILLIRRLEWAKRFNPGPSFLTLSEESIEMEDLLSEISSQLRPNVDLQYRGDPYLLSVKIDRLPLFQAIDQICRLDGNLDFQVVPLRDTVLRSSFRNANLEKRWKLILEKRPYTPKPRLFQDQFMIWISKIQMTERINFGRGETKSGKLILQSAWEPDTVPTSVSFRLKSLTDEKGNSLLDHLQVRGRTSALSFASTPGSFYSHPVLFQTPPPPEVKVFAKVAGDFVVTFPRDTDLVSFSREDVQKGSIGSGTTFQAELQEVERSKGKFHIKVKVTGQTRREMPKMHLVTKKGQTIAGRMTGSQTTFGQGISWQSYEVTFERTPGMVVDRLEMSIYKGSHEKVIPIEFRNVRFRP
jgi:hypothetical protein